MIPDAPWIRDAENNGIDDKEYTWYCPVCGAENPERIYTFNGDVWACDQCLESQDGIDWALEHPEDARLKEV